MNYSLRLLCASFVFFAVKKIQEPQSSQSSAKNTQREVQKTFFSIITVLNFLVHRL